MLREECMAIAAECCVAERDIVLAGPALVIATAAGLVCVGEFADGSGFWEIDGSGVVSPADSALDALRAAIRCIGELAGVREINRRAEMH